MKLNLKKVALIFSLFFILLISSALVCAEELESSDSVSDGVDYQVSGVETKSNPSAVDDGHSEPYPVSGNVITSENDVNAVHHSEAIGQNGEAISYVGDCNGNVVENNVFLTDSNINDGSDNLKAVADVNYSISVKNISATENTNVTIIANVKNYDTPVEFGYVLFSLWDDDGNDIGELVPVENGQAVLKTKLPSIPKTSATNWLCGADFYDENYNYLVGTTFLTQIKKAVNPTQILVSNIIGKMGKKVTLVAKVYDEDGLLVTGGKVTFTVNGKSYTVDVKNGKASKTITSPFVGIYTVKVNYKGVGAYKASSAKFKLGSDLKIKFAYYKTLVVKKGAKKYYKITLTNYYTKKPLKSFKIKFKVKINKKTWKTYTLKSNSKGIIKWSTKKLSVGTHNVKICSAYKYFSTNLKGKIVVKRK
ncbi:MAG: Ig-like domain repeat protein [Methanobrevibacter olleyae]|uniref:Ig-like domain repeat protein n=1 Tax=Methanobrevibacter olleyae TaxID=294671 RepID=A0A8T3VRC9_METOL|nr:Ig-like domain repeat protein [Methanobrevibacter olleyae]